MTTSRAVASVDSDDDLLLEPTVTPDVIPVVTSDGGSLRVHAYGPEDGDPIVFIHGWTCRIEYWYPQINAFAKRHRVIAYDHRGHGESKLGRDRVSVEMLADDLQAVLDATVRPGKKALLVGHSMGGMTIMEWASRFPGNVNRLASGIVLASTGADRILKDTAALPILGKVNGVRGVLTKAVVAAPVPLPPLGAVKKIFQYRALSPRATDAQVDFCFDIVARCSPISRARWGLALGRVDVTRGLENMNVPVTVVAGTYDRLTPMSHSHKLVAQLEDAGVPVRLASFPGVGHMSNVEAATAFNEEVARLRVAGRQQSRYGAAAG
ncbi:MAG: alpha/beta hydrolase [Nocardiaceae bacterium]|nr:alpha/beta hydrolase [Nocardiaceae bacterium]